MGKRRFSWKACSPLYSSAPSFRHVFLMRALARLRFTLIKGTPWQILSVYRIVSQQGSCNLRAAQPSRKKTEHAVFRVDSDFVVKIFSFTGFTRKALFTFHLNQTKTRALSLRKMNFLSYEISSEQTISPLFPMTLHNSAPLAGAIEWIASEKTKGREGTRCSRH